MRYWFRCASVLLLGSVAACAPSLRVMTYNVRYASDQEPHSWAQRRPVTVAMLAKARPDLIGTQELLQRQGDDIIAALPAYRWFGRDRRGEHADEHMGIFYRTDRLRIGEQGEFWLSDAPEQPGSVSWGADLPRMANWAVFETRGDRSRRFLFVNTHLAHRPQDEGARDRSVALILSRLPTLAKGLPVVLAGDMNTRPDSAAYGALAAAATDARTAAARRRGPDGTFHDFSGTADRRIDYLFLRGFRVDEVVTDTYHQGSTYPSDHFPVQATLRFERAGAEERDVHGASR